ncbi:MAG: manganese efflux pump MntP family protein [Desulfomicrobium sp.]|jgi:putative Mn2+ efflux pump MntP|nr:manganese efflux pump MntP family protein [Desulfomicrobium sp.]
MSFLEILFLAIALAMDAFAVALGTGLALQEVSRRQNFRLSWHFGFFQGLMTILGWLGGQTLHNCFLRFGPWIACGLLFYIGGRMLWESFLGCEQGTAQDPTTGKRLIMLSVATSIDALAVGLTLAILHIPVWGPACIIALVASLFTTTGLYLGRSIGHRACLAPRAEALGGLILLGIGIKIVWQAF